MQSHHLQYRSILTHYGRHLRPYLRQQVYILASYACAGLIVIVIVRLLYKHLIDTVTSGGSGTYEHALTLITYLTGSIVAYNTAFRIGDYHIVSSQSRILRDLSNYVHRILQDKSYEFYTNTFAGSLIAKTRRFVNAFETLHDQFVFQLWMNGVQLLASVSVLWYESWVLGTVFLSWLALYLTMTWYLVRFQIPKGIAQAETDSRTTAHYSDIISNILTVKMFGTSAYEIATFEKTVDAQERARRASWLQLTFWNGLYQSLAVGVFEIVIMGISVELWHRGIITAGVIVLVQAYVVFSFHIVWTISKNIVRVSVALSDAQEMVALLDQPPDVQDISYPEPARITEGHIALNNVTFQYNGGRATVLKNLHLTIPAGQKVALVGHSGAGKSSLVKLLLRFVDVCEGSITIDGQHIAHITQQALRQHIAYVPQDPTLFHRSLRDNIAYARPDAPLEEVVVAAKRAHAHEFIETLPYGYDTLVGERGVKLSGGERQRIAIARALLKDAPIVILDEATSSLDSISERYIQAAFDTLMEGRTTIVIAHRLSTIQHMDRIIVLEDGGIVEDGTHAELLAYNGVYADLWNSQVGGFIEV
jgi:ATP-binding cassette, subfamily B, bacterial